jgi:3-hydroxyisobutyrate dehydrogenase-like beta-hydroxyacid dehydrogenase|tara:strand:- start:1417 stop:2268 length:852 start_codon:yes stop_codon:yes gene_type:complete
MSTEKGASVGIIGLGIIGSRIATTLREKGWQVNAWNRTPSQDQNTLESPLKVAQASNHIQIFVRDGEALLQVIETMGPGLSEEHIIINHATVSPQHTEEANTKIQFSGASFLDCPFTGSRDAAAGGLLNYYVGGDENVLEKVRPLLESSSNSITYLGQVGAATVLKIATNMISATTVAILAEALSVCENGGVDLDKMPEAMKVNACASGLSNMKLPTMLDGNYEPHFSLKNMLKDANFGLSIAERAGIDLPVLKSAAQTMMAQMNEGNENEDYSVVYRNFKGH